MAAGRVVLIDLDDTLVADRAAAREAVARTLRAVGHGGGPDQVDRILAAARRHWRNGPFHARLRDLGVSSWEGLWADLTLPALPGAGAWGRAYRERVWAEAALPAGRRAADAAAEFVRVREALVRPLPGAADAVARFGRAHELWLVTNGAARLQRRKLRLSGLDRYVARVFVSAELGHAKPHPAFFRAVVAALDGRSVCALVGDSPAHDLRPAADHGWPAVDVAGRGIGGVELPCGHGP